MWQSRFDKETGHVVTDASDALKKLKETNRTEWSKLIVKSIVADAERSSACFVVSRVVPGFACELVLQASQVEIS